MLDVVSSCFAVRAMYVSAYYVCVLLLLHWLTGSVECLSALPSSWLRGTVLFQLEAGAFANSTTSIVLCNLTKTLPGTDTVALQFMWAQENTTSNEVFLRPTTSPSWLEVNRIILTAKGCGLKVFLKPLVVTVDGHQMFEINPSNITAWFHSYGGLLHQLAVIAESTKVEILSIGLELQAIATNTLYEPHWAALIGSVRQVFKAGLLTYSSNPLINETMHTPFWSLLDLVGIDLYIPYVLSRDPNASLIVYRPQMEAVFASVFERKVAGWYRQQVELHRKNVKLFIGESGYPSSNYGMQFPFLIPETPTCSGPRFGMNVTAQAVATEVMLDVLTSKERDYVDMLAGFINFWWGNPSTMDFYPDRHQPTSLYGCMWTPVGKETTMNVLRNAFAKTVS